MLNSPLGKSGLGGPLKKDTACWMVFGNYRFILTVSYFLQLSNMYLTANSSLQVWHFCF